MVDLSCRSIELNLLFTYSMIILLFLAVSFVVFDHLLHSFFTESFFTESFHLESFISLEDSKKYNPYYMDPRIIYSLQSALLFFIIASPQVYSITGKLFSTKGTPLLVIHSIVFAVLVYVLMRING